MNSSDDTPPLRARPGGDCPSLALVIAGSLLLLRILPVRALLRTAFRLSGPAIFLFGFYKLASECAACCDRYPAITADPEQEPLLDSPPGPPPQDV